MRVGWLTPLIPPAIGRGDQWLEASRRGDGSYVTICMGSAVVVRIIVVTVVRTVGAVGVIIVVRTVVSLVI